MKLVNVLGFALLGASAVGVMGCSSSSATAAPDGGTVLVDGAAPYDAWVAPVDGGKDANVPPATDGGADAVAPGTDGGTDAATVDPCKQCLTTKCTADLGTCASDNICMTAEGCILNCPTPDQGEMCKQACIGTAEAANSDGGDTALNTILACAQTNCLAQCFPQTVDSGAADATGD